MTSDDGMTFSLSGHESRKRLARKGLVPREEYDVIESSYDMRIIMTRQQTKEDLLIKDWCLEKSMTSLNQVMICVLS